MISSSRNLIGRGPSFPYNRSESGGLAYTEDIARINQSLFLLFETRKGSRLMMPEYGSDIYKYKFDPIDAVLLEKLRYIITEDISKWEPRIALTSVEFLSDHELIDNNILYISISYNIKRTNTPANYVYPYKLETYNTLEISYE